MTEPPVIELTARERLYRKAAAPWIDPHDILPDGRLRKIDGKWFDDPAIAPEVRDAVASAHPLPSTISEAYDELAELVTRSDALRAVFGADDWQLDAPSFIRLGIVRQLFEVDLRATTLQEVAMRQQFAVNNPAMAAPEIGAAVLQDIEALISVEEVAPGSHPLTASERREQVVRMLADPDIAALSDREIGRRVGVTGATVAAVRRKAAEPAG
jgi:hypothetical protein